MVVVVVTLKPIVQHIDTQPGVVWCGCVLYCQAARKRRLDAKRRRQENEFRSTVAQTVHARNSNSHVSL